MEIAWLIFRTLRMTLPLSQGNFFMKADGQPVEVRANFVSDEEVQKALHLDDFDFRPSEN
jgi:hypothetical protein